MISKWQVFPLHLIKKYLLTFCLLTHLFMTIIDTLRTLLVLMFKNKTSKTCYEKYLMCSSLKTISLLMEILEQGVNLTCNVLLLQQAPVKKKIWHVKFFQLCSSLRYQMIRSQCYKTRSSLPRTLYGDVDRRETGFVKICKNRTRLGRRHFKCMSP